jgi:TP901 family phage tail tape measure protein
MANIELKIVALGDFSSVNNQIKALQAQVELLQKGVAGVGLNSQLSSQLKSIQSDFSSALMSSGNFTKSTVQLTSETEKFGKALQSGKLSLGQYFGIITGRSSEAQKAVNALAVEQVKLNNSIVQSDITKQGVYSVYTPTKINELSKSTEIAAAKQNIYNLAVREGSTQLINFGKNTQWAGRQLTVGLAMPAILFGSQAVTAFKAVNTELTRLQRLYGEGLTPPSQAQIDKISGQVLDLGKNIASSMGIAQSETVKVAANFAAMGKEGQALLDITTQTQRLSKLGAIDATQATNTIVSLQNVYKVSTADLSNAVNFLSSMQKQTTMSLQDMTDAIPRVGPIMAQLGGSYKDTAVMLLAMREAGVPAAQAANALKSAFASMIAPTSAASKEFAKFGVNLDSIKNAGSPVKMLMSLQSALVGIAPLAREQLIEKLFGKFQFARVSALLDNFGKVGSQTQNALKVAGATNAQLATLAGQEMAQATESTTAKWHRAIETLKADLYPIGQKILEVGTKIIDFGQKIVDFFNKLPGPIKSGLGILLTLGVISGPIIMITGLLANLMGQGMKVGYALFGIVDGTKKWKDLMTPASIAAKTATEVFNEGLLTNVASVDALNAALQRMITSLTEINMTRTGGTGGILGAVEQVAVAEAGLAGGKIPFKMPGMATGGFIPGSGDTDSFPAMLMPGEAVIPKGPAQKYQSFISAMIDGKLPGFMSGSSGVYYGGTRRGKPSTERPSELQGVAETSLSQYGLPGEQAKLAALTEQLGAKYNLSPSQMSNISGAHLLNLAHVAPAQKENYKGAERKVWDVNNLRVSSGAENKAHEYLGRQESFTNAITQAGAMQGPAGIAAAEAINAGKQPMSKLEQSIFIEAVNSIEKQVKEGKLKDMPSFKTGYVARDIMIARNAGNQGLSSDISSLVVDDPSVAKAVARNKASGAKIGKAVTDGLNKELEVNSPSAKTQKTGKAVADGLRLGIEENAGQVKAAAAELGQSVSTTIEEETLGKSGAPNGGLFGRLKNMATNESGKMNIQSKMALSGGLMMGGGMLAGMLPKGSNLSNIAGNVSTMAGMGAMLGPWGTAAGAALGLVTGGISALMKAEKEHQAVVTATFSASSDVITEFGGTMLDQSVKIHTFATTLDMTAASVSKLTANVNAISKMDPKTSALRQVSDSIKSQSTASSVIGTAEAFAAAQVANGMDPSQVKDLVSAMITYAGKTQYLNAALKEISKNTKDIKTATSTWLDKLKEAAGPLNVSITSYAGLNTQQKLLANGMLQVANRMMDSSTPFKTMISMAEGLTSSVGSTTAAFNMLIMAANNAEDIKFSDILNKLSGKTSLGTAIIAANLEQDNPLKKGETQSQYAERLVSIQKLEFQKKNKDIQAANNAAMTKYHSDVAAAQKSSANIDTKALKDAKDKLKVQKDILTAMQKQTAEIQKQQQYNLSQADLDNQIRLATASGDFLQANLLRQQKNANSVNYNGTTAQQKQQDIVDKLQASVDAMQLSQDTAKAKASSIANMPVPAMTPLMSNNDINSNITLLIAALKDLGLKIDGILSLGSNDTSPNSLKSNSSKPDIGSMAIDPKTKKPYIVSPSQGRNPSLPFAPSNGVIQMHNPKFSSNSEVTGPYSILGYTDPKTKYFYAGNGFVYTDQSKKNMIGQWAASNQLGVMKAYSVGGFVSGMGTGTSDSILSRLSHGEYVTKAASVAKYGTSFMDSINSGSYNPSFPNAGAHNTISPNSGTIGGATYNITVNAGSNASADDIAKSVMDTIKRQTGMTSTNRRISV